MNLKFFENFISALSFKLPLNGAVAQWLFVYFPCAQDADLPDVFRPALEKKRGEMFLIQEKQQVY